MSGDSFFHIPRLGFLLDLGCCCESWSSSSFTDILMGSWARLRQWLLAGCPPARKSSPEPLDLLLQATVPPFGIATPSGPPGRSGLCLQLHTRPPFQGARFSHASRIPVPGPFPALFIFIFLVTFLGDSIIQWLRN